MLLGKPTSGVQSMTQSNLGAEVRTGVLVSLMWRGYRLVSPSEATGDTYSPHTSQGVPSHGCLRWEGGCCFTPAHRQAARPHDKTTRLGQCPKSTCCRLREYGDCIIQHADLEGHAVFMLFSCEPATGRLLVGWSVVQGPFQGSPNFFRLHASPIFLKQDASFTRYPTSGSIPGFIVIYADLWLFHWAPSKAPVGHLRRGYLDYWIP